MSDPIVIVGASHAGAELALALRTNGFDGRVVLVGEECHLPYQRPPLSKAFLGAAPDAPPQLLRPASTYEQAAIEFIGDARVVRIDRAAKALELEDGRALAYSKLAMTTGARVRRLPLPGAERAVNVVYLRTADDARALRALLRPDAKVVVIGGGYVGLEVAASGTKRGAHVTVIEAQPRVLARVTGTAMSAFYESVHRAAGVTIRTGIVCEGLEVNADGSRVVALQCRELSTERLERIEADAVVVGIGVIPNDELAASAGLTVDDGIVVDTRARTSDPDIVAAGDCTRHPSDHHGGALRLESVQNAVEQARVAAATLCGQERHYQTIPWFWSDQFDLKLQMVGLSQGHDTVVLRGHPPDRSFAAFYLRDGRLIAADVVNRPKDFMHARKLVAAGARPDVRLLADDAADLAALLAPPGIGAGGSSDASTQSRERKTTIDVG